MLSIKNQINNYAILYSKRFLKCCFSLLISGLDLIDEEKFCDTLDDVVTSVKRNGVAIKGRIHCALVYCRDIIHMKWSFNVQDFFKTFSDYYLF